MLFKDIYITQSWFSHQVMSTVRITANKVAVTGCSMWSTLIGMTYL